MRRMSSSFYRFIPLCFYLSFWLWFIGAILLSTDRGSQVTLREAARLKKEKMKSLPGFHFMRAYHETFYLFNSSLAWSNWGPGRDGRRGVGGRCKTLPCPCFLGTFFVRLTGWSGLWCDFFLLIFFASFVACVPFSLYYYLGYCHLARALSFLS